MSSHPGPVKNSDFVELFSAHARRIYSFILTLVSQESDADDVFQEASKVLWQKFDLFTPGTNFYSWACRIAYFQVLYWRQRQQKGGVQFDVEFLEAVSTQVLEDAELLESQHRALDDCLNRLAPQTRRMVWLRFGAGKTTRLVAEQIGLSLDAAYKALNRAQRTLLECVERALRREEASS